MKEGFATSYVYMSPEGESGGGGTDTYANVGDAVAELTKRGEARANEAKAASKESEEDSSEPQDLETDNLDGDELDNDSPDNGDDVATDDGDAPADDIETKADLVEIEQDGEKFNVPAKFKDAFLRQADYTRKTQEVASERAQVHAVYQQTQAMTQTLQQQQYQLAQYAQSMIGQAPSPDMIQNDPQGYLAQRAAYEQRYGQFQALMEQNGQLTAQQQQLQSENDTQFKVQEAKALFESMPEMRDTAKRQQFSAHAAAAIAPFGFTALEVNQIMDHRQVKLLKAYVDQAAKLKRYESADKDVRKQLSNVAPRVQRPGVATPNDGRARDSNAKNDFMKSGRTMKDVARWVKSQS